jgi:hypothetical protein
LFCDDDITVIDRPRPALSRASPYTTTNANTTDTITTIRGFPLPLPIALLIGGLNRGGGCDGGGDGRVKGAHACVSKPHLHTTTTTTTAATITVTITITITVKITTTTRCQL